MDKYVVFIKEGRKENINIGRKKERIQPESFASYLNHLRHLKLEILLRTLLLNA
jgi:hypothetical protein